MASIRWLFVRCLLLAMAANSQTQRDALMCKNEDLSWLAHTTEEEYRKTTCCKVVYSRGKWYTSWRDCENAGCCGEEDNQECCSADSDSSKRSLTSQEIGIIVGCSIFGLIVLILLIILFIWVGKKCSTGIRDYKGHKTLLKEVYNAQTLDELFVPAQDLVSAPGTIVHPVINANEPYHVRRNDPTFVVPSPFQQQPQAPSLQAGGSDDVDFGDEANWDRWGSSPNDVQISTRDAPGSWRGRDNPHSQLPPSYETVVR